MHADIALQEVRMSEDELAFMKSKRDEELPLLFKSIRFFAILCVLVVVAFGITMYLLRKYSGEIVRPMDVAPPDIFKTCLSGLIGLFVFVGLIIYYSFNKTLKKIIKDVKRGNKTVEPCSIIRKVYMKENDRYYLFLTSNAKLSIEVSPDDYYSCNEGDIVFIEYSTYARVYFGYNSGYATVQQ